MKTRPLNLESRRTAPRRGLLLVAAVAASALTLSACGAQPAADAGGKSITVEHTQGTTDVPANPETVYTFDLGVLDTLDALDVDVDGVPQGVLPEQLADYDDDAVTDIGSMKEPDFEAISSGDPDLIIISGRTSGAYEELSKIAPTIDLSVDDAEPMKSFKRVTTTLGKIFDKQDEVDKKLAELQADIDETKSLAASSGTGLIVLTSGGELTAYGAGSRFGIIHDVMGVKTAADIVSDGPHGKAVSFEYLAETDPDHLFVIDRDAAIGRDGPAAKAILDNELVDGTSAAQKNQITYLDAAAWYLIGYGLDNVESMVDTVQDALKA